MTIKKRLKNSKLARKTQAMITQAVVESTMTFSFETRAWRKKEIKEMQKIVDYGYRFVCMNKKRGPALKQMEENKLNM